MNYSQPAYMAQYALFILRGKARMDAATRRLWGTKVRRKKK